MPSIKDIQTWVEVRSSVYLDCGPAHAQWEQANSSYVAGTQSFGGAHTFSCESTAKKPISTGAKIGMAFGILALLAAIFFTVVWAMKNWWRRRPKNNAPRIAPLSEHELDQRPSRHGEMPPPYKGYPASVHSEIGPLAEPKSAF
jgi:hypothetical protein